MPRASFRDCDGAVVVPGDRVRVLTMPNLAGMRSPYREETESVFRHIKGSVKRVHGVDDRGNGILVFFIRSGKLSGYHSVAIEGEHVRRVQARVVV
jgi:hypothetical protein